MADETKNLETVQKYAAEQSENKLTSGLKRYAASSAQFAALGGAVGSVVPGVGTALGAMVGVYTGLGVEAAKDVIDFFEPDEMRHVKEDPDKAEMAFYAYEAMGGEKGTGLAYPQWWKLYVAAGRPSVDVLKATKKAEREAKKLARDKLVPPPPPPPPKEQAMPKANQTPSRARRETMPKANQTPSRARRELQVFVDVATGVVRTGRFARDARGVQGFVLDLSQVRVSPLSGKWVRQ